MTGALATPDDLDVHTFRIGTDEYVVLSFPVSPDGGLGPIAGVDRLTSTEQAIVALVVRGLSNAAIGRERGTTARTIANQLTGIYRKLGLQSRRELCASARRGRAI